MKAAQTGFVLMFDQLPEGLNNFVELVVSVL